MEESNPDHMAATSSEVSQEGPDLDSMLAEIDLWLSQSGTGEELEQKAEDVSNDLSADSFPGLWDEEEQQPSAEDNREEPKEKFKKVHHGLEKGYSALKFMTGRMVVYAKRGGSVRQFSHCLCPVCCSVFELKEDYDRHVKLAAERSNVCTKRESPDSESLAVLKKLTEEIFLCCSQCDLMFLSQKRMERHQTWHDFSFSVDKRRRYVCHACRGTFQHKDFLSRHLRLPPGKEYCLWCGVQFQARCQMMEHDKRHNNTVECETCGQSFAGMVYAQIQSHKESHMPVHICEICGVTIHTSKTSLASHMRWHAREEKSLAGGGQRRASRSQDPGPQSSSCVICQHCGCSVPEDKFSSHEKKHLPPAKQEFLCPVCKVAFDSRAAVTSHMVSQDHMPYVCEMCGVKRSKQSSLIAHQKSCHTEGWHECGECKMRFKTFHRLKLHVHKVHRGRGPHPCPVCGKELACRETYLSHMRIHTGERPFQCPHCTASFARKDYLRKHIPLHTGRKEFVCEDCGKAHTTRSSLLLHRKNHHSDITYPCELCGQGFFLRSSLDYHTRRDHPQHVWT
ncbi:hypothetical protein ACOMHN_005635 [Nucella lapillus]